MKRSSEKKSFIPMFIVVFFLSIIIVLGIMEFRFLKNILTNYEKSIKQIAVNKTSLFINDLKAVSENAVKMVEVSDKDTNDVLRAISTYDHRITNIYLLDRLGTIRNTLYSHNLDNSISLLAEQAISGKNNEGAIISGVRTDKYSGLKVISVVAPLYNKNAGATGALVLDFRIDQYQKEMMQEFVDENYKVAVVDNNNYTVFWPFDPKGAGDFNWEQSKYYEDNIEYNVISSTVGDTSWRLYFYIKENNFETLRTITILFLIFALYCCLYQLLVELWGVNSAKTYFENIDFAIFNQINEGVLITNNTGRIIFANRAAHEIFAERKSTLMDIKLKEILGHIEDVPETKEKSQTLTLKISDKLLEAIHSPIIKNGKKLGSLTVLRVNAKEEKTFRNVLNKFSEVISEGVIYIDKNHEVSFANLMARCYLGNLEHGTSIDIIDPELAAFIYDHIGSPSVRRTRLSTYNLLCEIAPVFDDDGVYAGTLVVLLTGTDGCANPLQ